MKKTKFVSVRMQQKDWDQVRKTFNEARKILGSSKLASDNEVVCDMVATGTKQLDAQIKSYKETL
jgi:hypothetical protein